jgi:ribonuclease G
MSIDHVLISASPGETRTALLTHGRLVEILISRAGGESLVGNVYLGRVASVNKGLDAAFVDIGTERDGFLAVAEARTETRPAGKEGRDAIGDYLNEGVEVLVQVTRDPLEHKGAKLTTRMTLPGVNLIFRPRQAGIAISRRIDDDAVRARLTDLITGLAPKFTQDLASGGGFIVRTAAAGSEAPAIEEEAARLTARWREIEDRAATAKPPRLLLAEVSPAFGALRDGGGSGIEKIIADDADALAGVRGFCEAEMPAQAKLLELHQGPEALFEAYGVEEQIDAALSPTVALPGGGSLIISQTPALTAIDVNTGSADKGSRERTAFQVNLEAAHEVVRQIRLRNLSGLIVIDFVPVRDNARKQEVVDALRQAAAAASISVFIAGTTRLGLVEMTRPRHGPTLLDILCGVTASAPTAVKSPLTLALEALRAVLRRGGGTGVTLKASPDVIEALRAPEGPGSAALALRQAEQRLGLAIGLARDHTLAEGRYDIVAEEGE